MVTAYGTIQNAVEAMKEGAFDYILKPFSYEDLDSAVKRAMMASSSLIGRSSEKAWSGRSKGRPIVTQNPKMLKLMELARNIAASNATVLIQGESGTGKELLARFIFENSPRRSKPFVVINCAAIPENLLESELFGHEKGSFTGAVAQRIGKFELANHGTFLLDEIGEMSLQLQAKLLRVLQEFELDRVGGKAPIPIDVRVIATTNEDLHQAVENGDFREDLFYRLNVIPLTIPPLRERKEDISLLVEYFLKRQGEKPGGRKGIAISQEAEALLLKYDWKGNVRELENFVERAALVCETGIIEPRHFFLDGVVTVESEPRGVMVGSTVREMEKQLILKTLDEVAGNRTHAAKILGISIRTLRNKLNEYRVDPVESGENFAQQNGL
jgi:DNA-binding NtrC family response regulator